MKYKLSEKWPQMSISRPYRKAVPAITFTDLRNLILVYYTLEFTVSRHYSLFFFFRSVRNAEFWFDKIMSLEIFCAKSPPDSYATYSR